MPGQTAAPSTDLLFLLAETRERTLALVAHLDDAAVESVHSALMSPLVWDLGHIAAFEDLWAVHRFGGEPLLRPDLAQVYDAFETPRADRGTLPFLRRREALAYLEAVRERTLAAVARRGLGDGLLHELVLRHEQQHGETMLQAIELARLPLPPRAAEREERSAGAAAPGAGGLELIEIAAGPCAIGRDRADGFSYDNERPRHLRELPAFRIGRTPITNATFLTFVEGGGYERREWWSREAWAWKEEYDIERPAGWTADGREWRAGRLEPLHPDRPVVHVSWFEADAFARAHGARLPTEFEWEKAATWDQEIGAAAGDEALAAATGNVDWRTFGTVPVGAAGAPAPSGCLGMVGDTWEWTAGRFDGYPGFVAEPYREYSEVFFGDDGYRVLRGGSWATRARVATPTFRNWDHPQRRQIFAGFRIAKDV
ncbi:ergothioneine biosynthesis protein EgtB [Conexibacter arvalis]|uniref:Iron(II)-dependent oxidoreductase n=1 Tax=Conexibacter arvalis TaxID=912552 RepID=A0A840IJD4_9ACTN|nr:ergothioneine biosynthesis protein EgtB [Conexibacter arvalis]MBB4664341.1 iron(II)-dependent oxidoreductase [Conexibacter arvalis]